MNKRMGLAALSAVWSVGSFADPATLVVDRSGTGGAYVSIQAAVDAANAGDTILVRPGVYDNDFKTYNYTDDASETHTFTNRVTLTKKLHLKAVGRAAETVILGAWDERTSNGIGSAAIRCVYVDSSGAGSVIEGFTLRDGNCHAQYKADGKTTITDVLPNRGGGITSHGGQRTAFFAIGCVFDHCSGFRGGALRFGSAIRCRFVNVQGPGSCVGRGVSFLNCLIDGNLTDGGLVRESTLVNCTLVGNGGRGAVFSTHVYVYNSVCVGNNADCATLGGNEASATLNRSAVFDTRSTDNPRRDFFQAIDEYSVVGDTSVLFAPLLEDYRVRAGSAAVGLGAAEAIAENFDVSEAAAEIDLYRDFSGAEIPKTGAINAGCLQAMATAAGGCALFKGRVTAKGHAVKQDGVDLWAFSENPVDVFKVFAGGQPLYWKTPSVRPPELDGSAYFAIPGAGVTTTNEAVMPAVTLTVAKDGSAQYTTIQAALDAVSDNNGVLITVAPGDYDDVGGVDETNGDSCIKLTHAVRIVGAGRGVSTIRGRKAATADGRGDGASRCAYLANSSQIQIVQGFTLTGGRCAGTGTDNVNINSGGLVQGANIGYNFVLDCELSDGYAFRGSATRHVTLMRCRIHDVAASGGAIVRPGRIMSSILQASEGSGAMVDVQETYLYNSTLVSYGPSFTVGSYGQPSIRANYNTIYYSRASSGSALALGANTAGIVYYGNVTPYIQSETTPGYVETNPHFADAMNGDFRLCSGSAAITSGYADAVPLWADDCLSDVDGNPRLFFDGKPMPGAVQVVASRLGLVLFVR